ncbi:ABC transporter ATP-binding protein [Leifsonia sp. Root227]|uniref:ABC transporter ATP-binding protein n=1 Tax=unclassified Leifsonia TaxID=2663824 RepID=UPI0006FA9AAE|nr:ABC transporter ATP-binding protein [Leifsonia sp. Root227]KRC47033.1 ABC transporter ATP-binding protein [Leifsonia sp. Root227]
MTDTAASSASPLLSIRDLTVDYQTASPVRAVNAVSLDIHPGEIVGLAGESGCGKSTLAYTITRLLQAPAEITGGSIEWQREDGGSTDILTLDGPALRAFRWQEISMVFQGAMNALNPVHRIGSQIEDVFIDHKSGLSKKQRRERAAELLQTVGIPADRLRSYPHELSGGMRQRVMIAMALALRPRLIIMDEPTTALDVVVQRNILEEINRLRHEFGFAVLFITHDLGLLLEISDRVGVMLSGRLVEQDTPDVLLENPSHEYTRHLLRSFPSLRGDVPLTGTRYIDREEEVTA